MKQLAAENRIRIQEDQNEARPGHTIITSGIVLEAKSYAHDSKFTTALWNIFDVGPPNLTFRRDYAGNENRIMLYILAL